MSGSSPSCRRGWTESYATPPPPSAIAGSVHVAEGATRPDGTPLKTGFAASKIGGRYREGSRWNVSTTMVARAASRTMSTCRIKRLRLMARSLSQANAWCAWWWDSVAPDRAHLDS